MSTKRMKGWWKGDGRGPRGGREKARNARRRMEECWEKDGRILRKNPRPRKFRRAVNDNSNSWQNHIKMMMVMKSYY